MTEKLTGNTGILTDKGIFECIYTYHILDKNKISRFMDLEGLYTKGANLHLPKIGLREKIESVSIFIIKKIGTDKMY